jgi:hypothetical protein
MVEIYRFLHDLNLHFCLHIRKQNIFIITVSLASLLTLSHKLLKVKLTLLSSNISVIFWKSENKNIFLLKINFSW